MDIYKYINSKSISDHLRMLNWQFTPLEASCLIWRWNGPVDDRLEAWKQIIKEKPDQEIKPRLNGKGHPSLHRFLSEAVKIYKKNIDNFFYQRGDLICYKLSIRYSDGESVDHDMLFYGSPIGRRGTNYHSALSDMINDSDISFFEITKLTMEHEPPFDKVVFNSDLELVGLEFYDKELSDIELTFLDQWFYIPLPFRKGDIIYDTDRPKDFSPMVYEGSVYDSNRFRENQDDFLNGKYGDISDMYIKAYCITDNGDVFQFNKWDITKFDLYDEKARKEFLRRDTDNLKTYKLALMISKVMKGELSLESLLVGYDKLKYINCDDYSSEKLFAEADKLIESKDKQDE